MFVIWEPVLPTDWSSPSTATLRRISDSRAAQFWDKGDDVMIPPGWVIAAKQREPLTLGVVGMGIDLAPYGNAENAIGVRRGDNLVVDVPLTFSEAALGATVEVPTPDGPVSVKVKPGTQDGTLLRVKGKGAPKLKGSGRGDLLARVRVTVPKKLKKRERELLEELQKQSHDDPREALFS